MRSIPGLKWANGVPFFLPQISFILPSPLPSWAHPFLRDVPDHIQPNDKTPFQLVLILTGFMFYFLSSGSVHSEPWPEIVHLLLADQVFGSFLSHFMDLFLKTVLSKV